MRVHELTGGARRTPRRGARDERGAVAVVVALLSVVLLGIGAFSIDLGLSNVSTRNLQTASDAAALAGADVFRRATGTSCAGVLAAGQAQAVAAARAIRAENRPGSSEVGYDARCLPDGSIQVTYTSTGSTPRALGGILGRDTDYTTRRTAVARVTTVSSSGGVRPYAVCGAQLSSQVGVVIKVSMPTTGTVLCPGADSSGNWWTVNCPGSSGNNSNSVLADLTLNGCPQPVSVVPGQVTFPARTPGGLRSYLETSCASLASNPSACLGADSGGIGGNQVLTAWTTLASEQRRIVLPVFCGGSPVGPCDRAAVVTQGGNNAIYPVQSLVGVQICGYRFGNASWPAPGTALGGACGGVANPSNLDTDDPNGQRSQLNYLLLRLVDVPLLGGSGSSTCELGSVCDRQRIAFLIG